MNKDDLLKRGTRVTSSDRVANQTRHQGGGTVVGRGQIGDPYAIIVWDGSDREHTSPKWSLDLLESKDPITGTTVPPKNAILVGYRIQAVGNIWEPGFQAAKTFRVEAAEPPHPTKEIAWVTAQVEKMAGDFSALTDLNIVRVEQATQRQHDEEGWDVETKWTRRTTIKEFSPENAQLFDELTEDHL